MIHGDRRGGRTTQGCIALEDRDILELFPKIPVGTRVIVKP
jgi:lipoprotein-anchoring transpeptidase ErfK/SrfK